MFGASPTSLDLGDIGDSVYGALTPLLSKRFFFFLIILLIVFVLSSWIVAQIIEAFSHTDRLPLQFVAGISSVSSSPRRLLESDGREDSDVDEARDHIELEEYAQHRAHRGLDRPDHHQYVAIRSDDPLSLGFDGPDTSEIVFHQLYSAPRSLLRASEYELGSNDRSESLITETRDGKLEFAPMSHALDSPTSTEQSRQKCRPQSLSPMSYVANCALNIESAHQPADDWVVHFPDV